MGVSFVMAGALGNIYDRLVYRQVRDFVHITARFNDIVSSWPDKPIWPWIWNIADASLIAGVCAILLSQLRSPHPDAGGKPKKQP
jgi:lipoprotein signal peptidase